MGEQGQDIGVAPMGVEVGDDAVETGVGGPLGAARVVRGGFPAVGVVVADDEVAEDGQGDGEVEGVGAGDVGDVEGEECGVGGLDQGAEVGALGEQPGDEGEVGKAGGEGGVVEGGGADEAAGDFAEEPAGFEGEGEFESWAGFVDAEG